MRIISLVFSCCMILSVFIGCGKANSSETQGSTQAEFAVEAAPVRQTEWVEDIATYGMVKPPDKVDIFPRMPGKITKLLVKEEQSVQPDDVLALIDRDEVGQDYKPVEVKATAAGKVETINLKEGAKVSDMTSILTIAKTGNPKILSHIFETDMPKLKLGLECLITLDALPEQTFKGTITLIKSQLHTQSSKGEVEITFNENHPEIMPGMFVRVRVVVARRTALVIMPECLKKIEGKETVYVARDNMAKLVFVELGSWKTDTVEVTHGLTKDDTVITLFSDELKDGSHIKIIKGE
jgi:multidrug efflux pump subunit AcrA (membrane-fusion protein)